MENGLFTAPTPRNEVILDYKPGSAERQDLQAELERQKGMCLEIPLLIGGKEILTDHTGQSVCPHKITYKLLGRRRMHRERLLWDRT